MPKHTYLMRRGSVYYFRMKLPEELVSVFGKREIRISLNTKDRSEAVPKLYAQIAQINKKKESAAKAERELAAMASAEDEAIIEHAVVTWFQREDKKRQDSDFDDMMRLPRQEIQERLSTMEDDLAAYTSPYIPSGELQCHEPDEYSGNLDFFAKQIAGARELEISEISPSYGYLSRLALRANIELLQRSRDRLLGKPAVQYDDFFWQARNSMAVATVANLSPYPKMTLGELMEIYLKRKGEDYVASTINKYKTLFWVLESYWGKDRQLTTITREDCEKLVSLLKVYPKDARKYYPKSSFLEIIEKSKGANLDVMEGITINNYITHLASLLNFAARKNYCQQIDMSMLRVKLPKKLKEYNSFELVQLQRMFAMPLYRGCVNDMNGYAKPGPNIIRRGKFWVPLLSLYMGMRCGECCQIEVDDICEKDGIPVLKIQERIEDGKRVKIVKTRASVRIIPIHPELIKLGFLNTYYERKQQRQTKLFPELKTNKHGYYSDIFGKWFKRFLEKCGCREGGRSFHNLRHTYRDALRDAGIPDPIAEQLGGWALSERNASAAAHYGRGASMKTLYNHITQMHYEGVDLSHLYLPEGERIERVHNGDS